MERRAPPKGHPSERGRGRRRGEERRLQKPFHTFGKETGSGDTGLRTGRRRRRAGAAAWRGCWLSRRRGRSLRAGATESREGAGTRDRARAGGNAAAAQAVTSSRSLGRRRQQPEPDSLTSHRGDTLRGR